MDTKQIINLDAFTKGLNTTTRSVGGILPVAAISIIESNVSGMASFPYATQVIGSAFFLWKTYTASNAMGV
jgi:hypothetical protein